MARRRQCKLTMQFLTFYSFRCLHLKHGVDGPRQSRFFRVRNRICLGVGSLTSASEMKAERNARSRVERPCMRHINVPGHQSHVPITGHALMASSSLLSFAPSPTQANRHIPAIAAAQTTWSPQGNATTPANPSTQADFMSQNTAWTLPCHEIGRLLELSAELDLVGHITPVEAWNRICQRCRPRGISKRAFVELRRELVENTECHG